jgi:ribose-phosphate pyrophosphokinase
VPGDLRFFALESRLGEDVACACGVELSPHEVRPFEDGEHKVRPLVSVRGADVFVLHSLYGDASESVSDKLCMLLFFLAALRDAGAGRVTAVTPYLCYGRKDRRTKPRDPVTTRYVAALFEAVGIDAILTVDVHNLAAFENAFRCPTVHLEARPLLVVHFAALLADRDVVVVSPDIGGAKRADRFRDGLAHRLGRTVEMAFVEKRRSGGVVSGDRLVGEVRGRAVVILDDLVSTGTTLSRAAKACAAAGAGPVYAAATHGLFLGDAGTVVADEALEQVVTTDTVPPFRLEGTPAAGRHVLLPVAPLLGEAIRRLHTDGSIVELVEAV